MQMVAHIDIREHHIAVLFERNAAPDVSLSSGFDGPRQGGQLYSR